MSKKIYGLEFTFKNKDGEIKMLSLDDIKIENKDDLIQENCHNLMYNLEAIDIVVKETCIYKVF